MGKNTPCLDSRQKHEYIALHLYNELRWLLGAATEWFIQKQLNLGIVGYNVQVYAMDSASLHARTLFEFFVESTNDNHYGSDVFVGTVLTSDIYKDHWKHLLNRGLMHAANRTSPASLKSVSGEDKELNEMSVEFAHEALRLWEEFEGRLGKSIDPEIQKLQELAREKRKEAIKRAECVVNSTVARHHAEVKRQVLSPIFVFAD